MADQAQGQQVAAGTHRLIARHALVSGQPVHRIPADEAVRVTAHAEVAIADVQRAKLVVDTKKWKLSRIVPKYGDRMAHTGADGGPIKIEAAIADVLADVYGDED